MREATRNDRGAIIALMAEWYLANDERLRRALIRGLDKMPSGLHYQQHGAHRIAYDEKANIIYWGAAEA